MPYNLLLHRDARDALGIDLTNQIVVVDEAHSKCFAMPGYNLSQRFMTQRDLISSLLSLSTVTLPLRTLELCLEQLTAYISRFKNRLTSKHVLHLKRLYRLLHTLRGLFSNQQQQAMAEVMTVDGLLSKLGGKLEEINFLEIQNYLRKSKARRSFFTNLSYVFIEFLASQKDYNLHKKGKNESGEKRSAGTDSPASDGLTGSRCCGLLRTGHAAVVRDSRVCCCSSSSH